MGFHAYRLNLFCGIITEYSRLGNLRPERSWLFSPKPRCHHLVLAFLWKPHMVGGGREEGMSSVLTWQTGSREYTLPTGPFSTALMSLWGALSLWLKYTLPIRPTHLHWRLSSQQMNVAAGGVGFIQPIATMLLDLQKQNSHSVPQFGKSGVLLVKFLLSGQSGLLGLTRPALDSLL
jgi:hypothetical protein